MKIKLTNKVISNPPSTKPVGRQCFYWDTEVPGLGLAVSPTNKSFVAQGGLNGKTKRVTIGKVGVYTLKDARDEARRILQRMRDGDDPRRQRATEKPHEKITLSQAIDQHVANMRAKECAERTLRELPYVLGLHLPDWMDKPLVDITPAMCDERHKAISAEGKKTTANKVFQRFRPAWNSARKIHPDLPETPTKGVTWNKQRRKRSPIGWGDLPGVMDKIDSLGNPIRRDLWWFVLLTGLRSTDARTVRWEHVDFKRGTIHRPNPKGGEDRAFTVPVSGYVLELLKRRKTNNERDFGYDDCGWVWPSWGEKIQPISQLKEQEYWKDEDGKSHKRSLDFSPHRFRDTFATAGHEARVHPLNLKILMNHTLTDSNDVTEGYIRPSTDHLREDVEKITAYLLLKAGRGEVSSLLRLPA